MNQNKSNNKRSKNKRKKLPNISEIPEDKDKIKSFKSENENSLILPTEIKNFPMKCDELQALQAIFMQDLTVKKEVTKRCNGEFSINIVDQNNDFNTI